MTKENFNYGDKVKDIKFNQKGEIIDFIIEDNKNCARICIEGHEREGCISVPLDELNLI